MFKTVYANNNDILHAINALYLHDKGFCWDATFGHGCFYKKFPEPKIKSDLDPSLGPDVLKIDLANYKNELAKSKIKRIVFDPPFLVRTGPHPTNHMCQRYSYFESHEQMIYMYKKSLDTFFNILQPKGILVFKCMDYSNGCKNFFTHTEVLYLAQQTGFKPIDLFIKISDRVIKRSVKRQRLARKYHCYFWVFRKI